MDQRPVNNDDTQPDIFGGDNMNPDIGEARHVDPSHRALTQSASLPTMTNPLSIPIEIPLKPQLIIKRQPTNKCIRFRYKCEDRIAGSIPGFDNTPENKTFPTIEIINCTKEVKLIISCVTVDTPYRQHPHQLVSREGDKLCKYGTVQVTLKPGNLHFELQKVGIQCVKRNDIKESLMERQSKNIDPFCAKFDHMNKPNSINLNQLRLCYQAFMVANKSLIGLDVVVSTPIYGKSNELTIKELSHCASKMSGGDRVIMLCDAFKKNDIAVKFIQRDESHKEIWSKDAHFHKQSFHKQVAISFDTPSYKDPEHPESVQLEVQLVRPSDGATSAPVPYEYYPNPGILTFARLQRKLKRKQDLDVFQHILSLDSETTATKYSCPPLDLNEDDNTVSSEDQQSSETLNDFEIAVKNLQLRHRAQVEANEADASITEYTDGMDNDNDQEPDMEIELEVPQLLPQLADDCTQTSTPMEEILQQPQLQSRPLSNADKINEWMKSSEFERTDSLTVENGDTVSLTHSTAQTIFTNVSSLTANTTITNQLDDEEKDLADGEINGSRRDTLENATLKDLPVGEDTFSPKSVPVPVEDKEVVSASAQASVDIDENFDETATYTSLQIAFNHPVEMPQNQKKPDPVYHASNPFSQLEETELVVLTNPPAPRIKVNAAQTPATPPSPPLPLPPRTPSPDPDQRLPPLPPKPRNSQDLSVSEHSVSNSVSLSRSRNGSVSSTRTTPSPIVIMRTPDQSPTKRQPTVIATGSSSASASPKKRQGFFSRLFSRRRSKNDDEDGKPHSAGSRATTPSGSREPSLAQFNLGDPNRHSIRSLQPPGLSSQNSVQRSGKPVGRSSSSVSGKRPAYMDADVIHIPLKGGDSENSLLRPESYSNASTLTYGRPLDRKTLSTLQLADIPISDGNMELVAIADRQSIKNLCEGAYGVVLDPSVDLSEAEHFALYTSKSPEPDREIGGGGDGGDGVADGGDFLSADEIARRLAEANGLQ